MSVKKRRKLSNKSNDLDLSIAEMTEFVQEITGGALVVVSDQLFWFRDGSVELIKTPAELFARLNDFFDFDWRRDGITKEEFFAGLKHHVPKYDWATDAPHFPQLPKVLYLTPKPAKSNTGMLDKLVDCFSPESDTDRVLLKAFILTLFWGGPGGKRPVFTITSDTSGDSNKGRGAGKTTFIEICSMLVGGTIAIRPNGAMDRTMAVLLTPSAAKIRVALIDNLKTFRFSSEFVESLVTCTVINGHRLHYGHASRPNYITFSVTVNGASYSKDMAERSVVIKLKQPVRSGAWYNKTVALIKNHREKIIQDIHWHLTRKLKPIKKYGRWELWCLEILGRLPDPDKVIALLEKRRRAIDEDGHATVDYTLHVEACIRAYAGNINPDSAKVFIPSPLMLVWMRQLYPQIQTGAQVAGVVAQHLSDRIQKKHTAQQRGYLWTGENAATNASTKTLIYKVKPAT